MQPEALHWAESLGWSKLKVKEYGHAGYCLKLLIKHFVST